MLDHIYVLFFYKGKYMVIEITNEVHFGLNISEDGK